MIGGVQPPLAVTVKKTTAPLGPVAETVRFDGQEIAGLLIDRHGKAAIGGIAAGVARRGQYRGRAHRERAAAGRIGGDKRRRTAPAAGVDTKEDGSPARPGRHRVMFDGQAMVTGG